MNDPALEDRLCTSKGTLRQIVARMKQRFSAEEYGAALEEVLRLERLVAEKRGEPYAAKWELPGVWDGMTLDCTVLGNQSKCLVIFETKPASGKFRILQFRGTAGYKLTDVGDEVIAAHSLTGRGLTAYGAFLVEHSPWIKELEQIDRTHPQFDAQKWRNTKHHMLCFKDRMFEALATEATLAGEAASRETATTIALAQLGSR
jgi:hypothetical protein